MNDVQRRRDFEQALPWYVNGTLDVEGRKRVEAYLCDWPQARAELQRHIDIKRAMRGQMASAPADLSWDEYARLAGVDKQNPKTEEKKTNSLALKIKKVRPPRMHLGRDPSQQTSKENKKSFFGVSPSIFQRPAVALGAIACMMIEGGVIASMQIEHAKEADRFVAERSASSTKPLLRLRLKPDVKEYDARKLLLAADVRVVDGPSQLGDYSVSVQAGRIDVVRRMLANSPLVDLVDVVPNHGCCGKP